MGLGLGVLLTWIIGNFKIVELPADIYYLSKAKPQRRVLRHHQLR